MTSFFVSIRTKLIAIILLVAILTIVPVYMLSGWLQYQSLKNELAQNILINAKVVGEYCVSPLIFEDRPGATDILNKMAHVAYIQSASLYDKSGSIFSFFNRHNEIPPSEAPDYNDGYFMGNTFYIAVPVVYQEKNYGTIVIKALTNGMIQKTRAFYLTLFPGTLLILALAVFLAICVQKQISGPITQLAEITRTITTQTDYSIRAPQGKNDEIGYLCTGFNNMLDHVSQRKKQRDEAIAKLRQSETKFREMVENINDWVWECDLDGKFTYSSPAVTKILGYTPEEVVHKNFTDFVHDDLKPGAEKRFKALVSSKTSSTNEMRINVHKNGDDIYLETSAHPVYDNQHELIGYRGIDRDITQRVEAENQQTQLENQLHQAQKMESVGRLAGGVAHDFNNILSVIIGYAELSLPDIDKTNPLYENIATILESGHRAARLTQQLLAFSRKQIVQKKTLNLKKEIDNIIKMIGRLLGEDIHIRIIHGGEDFLISADRSQLEQIILNLSINARDAMPQGGQLTIETEEIILEEATLNYHFDISPGNYIRITVSDTGEGMSKEILEHIFEPFYTTKGQGKGTGLGLSTVYGIIKQNNGDIDVYSEPSQGTAFKIYLPRVYETSDKERMAMSKKPMGNRKCTETILLVEDDDMVRNMVHKTLSSLGYNIIEAKNGKLGETVFEAFQGTIDLLLTDVVMPEQNGIELAKALQRLAPELKVLLMSGYTENALIRSGLRDLNTHFIQKPVTPKTISRAVQNVLDN